MKNLLFLFSLACLMSCEPDVVCGQWMSTVNITPTTQFEKINNEWTYTAPVGLSYGLMYSFSDGLYAGAAMGGGIDFNGGGTGHINLSTPVLGFIGFQPSDKIFSFFAGYGENLSSSNQVIAFGIHMTGFATAASNTKYKSIAANDAYQRNKIGFKHD